MVISMNTESYNLFDSEFLSNYELQSLETIDRLPTKRLLTYFKKHKKKKYWFVCGCCGERLFYNEQDKKDDYLLQKYFKIVKEMLDEREHVEER